LRLVDVLEQSRWLQEVDAVALVQFWLVVQAGVCLHRAVVCPWQGARELHPAVASSVSCRQTADLEDQVDDWCSAQDQC